MRSVVALAIILSLASLSHAASRRYSSSDVQVNGYYRSNGTYVQPHYRSESNAYKWDNYNYQPSQPKYNNNYRGYNTTPNPGRFYDSNSYNDNE